jgi:Glyoxalase-like domain
MRVDHLVWYCPDLEQGEAHFARLTKTQPAYGGVHPGEGTRNALLSLGDLTYLEILARDPDQDANALDPELRALREEGLYHWAVGGVDLERVRENALSAGLASGSVVTGGRALPNGGRLEWSLFGIRNHPFGALVPFFIDWGNSQHPAKTAPRAGNVLTVEVSTTDPTGLEVVYRALGIEGVAIWEGRPSLTAIIETDGGLHPVRMVEPVPRGFVI